MAIYRLKNPRQDYPWGSTTDIPKLLAIGNPNQTPVAELWLGAHPKAPSIVVKEEGEQSLSDLIEEYPNTILGADTVERFGPSLPFLFKILASEKALALQVHPTKDQAKEGFEKENTLGISLDAPNSNYLDRNHKPEMLCSLDYFWCLAGFRSIVQIPTELKSLRLATIGKEIDLFVQSRTVFGLKRLFRRSTRCLSHRIRFFIKASIPGLTNNFVCVYL